MSPDPSCTTSPIEYPTPEQLEYAKGRHDIKAAMRDNPIAPYCSICGRIEPRCGPDAAAVVCRDCSSYQAELWLKEKKGLRRASRPCPDCGGPLTKRHRVCDRCRKLRRSQVNRRYMAKSNRPG